MKTTKNDNDDNGNNYKNDNYNSNRKRSGRGRYYPPRQKNKPKNFQQSRRYFTNPNDVQPYENDYPMNNDNYSQNYNLNQRAKQVLCKPGSKRNTSSFSRKRKRNCNFINVNNTNDLEKKNDNTNSNSSSNTDTSTNTNNKSKKSMVNKETSKLKVNKEDKNKPKSDNNVNVTSKKLAVASSSAPVNNYFSRTVRQYGKNLDVNDGVTIFEMTASRAYKWLLHPLLPNDFRK